MSEFGSLNLDDMVSEESRLHSGDVSENYLDKFVPMPEVKPGQTGSVSIRILPPAKGGKLYQYNRTHKINDRSVHCPKPLNSDGKWDRNTPCPICDYYNSLWKQIDKIEKTHGKESDQYLSLLAEARSLKPSERYYYNAIVRSVWLDGKECKNVGPRILSVGKSLHGMIIKAIVGNTGDPDSKLGDISNLKTGYDFIIRKTITAGQDNYPNYTTSGFARASSPAGMTEEIVKWASELHDLTKLRDPRDVEFLERELAIHRCLIPDEVQESFNTETFDAKWKTPNSPSVKANAETKTKQVETSNVQETFSSSVVIEDSSSEEMVIEDEDFLKQLESMS